MTIRTSLPAGDLIERLARRGILGGVPVSRLEPTDPSVANLIVLAATELTTDSDISALCVALAGELA
jgi:glycine dehydrogenase subunit 1